MKNKLHLAMFATMLAMVGQVQATVTVAFKNFTSGSLGIPVVTSAGVPVAVNSVYGSAGIFSSVPNWGSASVSSILAAFAPIDSTISTSGAGPAAGNYTGSTPIANATYTGLISATDYSFTNYPNGTSIIGQDSYVVLGNNASLSLSTAIAVFKGPAYTALVAGNASNPLSANAANSASWVFGKVIDVTAQSTVPTSAFVTGIQLVPEPSAALLGALGVLGLLRRRRN